MQFLDLAPNKQIKEPAFLIALIRQMRMLLRELSLNLLRASLLEAQVGKQMAAYSLSLVIVMSYDEVSLHLGLSFLSMLCRTQFRWSQPYDWRFQPR